MISVDQRWAKLTTFGLALLVCSSGLACKDERGETSAFAAASAADPGGDAPEREAPAPAAPRPKSDDDEVPISPVYEPSEGLPDPLAQTLCDALYSLPAKRKAACCERRPSGDLSTYCARVLTSALAAGALRLNSEALDTCVRDVEAATEGCGWVTPLALPPPESCRALLEGSAELGQVCRSSLECEAGLFCQGLGPTQAGRCASPLAAGARCGGSVDTLAGYTKQLSLDARHPQCAGWCSGRTCIERAGPGEECSVSEGCIEGHRCLDKRCVPGAQAGLGERCSDSTCGPDAICVPVDESGTPYAIEWDARATGYRGICLEPKPAGAPCTSPFECQASCVTEPGSEQGTCGMQCTAAPV